MRYLPITEKERREMLTKIGVNSVEDLFSPLPKNVLLKKELNLPDARSEMEIEREMKRLGKLNSGTEMLSFLGGGYYRHHSPAIIDQLLLRSEFYTAYTPYQPEVSQGTLQVIFEFQTMISTLFGMDVANASMYDGATAAAEAVMMAAKLSKKGKKVLIASTMNPQYIATVKTYVEFLVEKVEMLDMDAKTGMISDSELAKIDEETICVLFQYPNYFGVIENLQKIAAKTKEKGTLLIPVVAEATSLGILATPGDLDADIAVGEGQAFGIPLNFGGPGVGLFTCKEKLSRKMPGRLVGQTLDKNGNKCYVLTLSAREQHIKREKATSNICSNQGLMATAASMYLATMGKNGLREVALMNLKRAEYLKKKIASETACKIAFSGHTYNEFTILVPGIAEKILKELEKEGVLGGIPAAKYYPELDNAIIVNTTEVHTYEELDRFVSVLKKVAGGVK
ncbi:MAG TPA: aminomethyl-transferring glycine dehydrogenase subunit GcvPA [bacterium]|nr:aminomethyl-transferring glycine dehydrogenase subunit GcvPA [bacterium]HPS29985.1 aminomethyl-transferring glycine dehydrogenase subunit GcvPA [bacterium]